MRCIQITDTHYGNSHKTHAIHERFLSDIAKIIKEQDIKVVIHSGDWTSNKQDQFRRTLAMHRRYITIPIVAVRGNHDLWDYHKDGYRTAWPVMEKNHEKWFKDNDIVHLEKQDFIIDDVIFTGFDGWYGHPYQASLYTRDNEMISRSVDGGDSMVYHAERAKLGFERVMALDVQSYRSAVCVTHFPPFVDDIKWVYHSGNRDFYEPLTDKFDILCVGHSHQTVNGQEKNNCKIYNPGADYDVPKYIIFEV